MMQYITTQGAQGICPSGWHIPTDDEFKILEGAVDSQYPVGDIIWNNGGWRGFDAGKNLKSTTGWTQNTGADAFGFTALPGGHCNSFNVFQELGFGGQFQSSSVNGAKGWYRRLVYTQYKIERGSSNKNYGISVRCLKD